MAVTSFAPAAAGLQPNEQWITSSTTWTKPDGVKRVEVTCVGGGGGGPAYGFGGSGGYAKRIIDVSSVPSVAVTVGAGGAAASAGGTTSFGSYLSVEGGQIPASSTSTNYALGGSGGIVTPYFGFDIETWSASYYKTSPAASSNSSIYYVNGKLFSIGGNNLSDHHMSSDNGVTWTNFSTASYAYSNSEIVYGNGVYLLFNLNSSTISNPQVSTNGTTWTNTSLPTTLIKTVVFAFGKFYAFYYGISSTYYTSTDGVVWSAASLPASVPITGAFGDGNNRLVVLVGSINIYATMDGTNWTQSNSSWNMSDGDYTSVILRWSKKNDNTYYFVANNMAVSRNYRYVYTVNFNTGSGSISSVTNANVSVASSTQAGCMVGKYMVLGTVRYDVELSSSQTAANYVGANIVLVPSTGEVWATDTTGAVIFKLTCRLVTNRFNGTTIGQYFHLVGGIGPGGYMSSSRWVATQTYTGYYPSPPIEGLAAGVSTYGSSKTYGEGGGQGGRGQDGVVILRWWS